MSISTAILLPRLADPEEQSPDLVAASPMPPAPQQIKDLAETVRSTTITMPEEAPSPRSTASSMLDDDLDDTMESQQTAATEITQPLALGQVAIPAGPSRVSQVSIPLRSCARVTPCLPLYTRQNRKKKGLSPLAVPNSTQKPFASAFASPSSKFKQTRSTFPSRSSACLPTILDRRRRRRTTGPPPKMKQTEQA